MRGPMLRGRIVDPLLGDRLAEVDAVDRPDDADDGVPVAVGRRAESAVRADSGREVLLHQVLVDDDDRGAAAVSPSLKVRPATSGICIALK